MDDLEIKITLGYKVAKNNLTLNGLLRGLERDQDEIMRNLLVGIYRPWKRRPRKNTPAAAASVMATRATAGCFGPRSARFAIGWPR